MISSHRNLLAILALVVLVILPFPLLASFFADLAPSAPPIGPSVTLVPVALIPTRIEELSPTATFTSSATLTTTASTTPSPTSTSTLTATATSTFTPTSTPTPTATETATDTPTPTPLPRTYLFPFVQVFAVGQAQLKSSSQVLMYEGGADTFEILTTQGTSVRLQTADGSMNFWTSASNASSVQPPPAQYDYSVKGQTEKLASSSIFACSYNDRPVRAFGVCQQLNKVSTTILNARVIVGPGALYIAQINGGLYVIPSSAVLVSQ